MKKKRAMEKRRRFPSRSTLNGLMKELSMKGKRKRNSRKNSTRSRNRKTISFERNKWVIRKIEFQLYKS